MRIGLPSDPFSFYMPIHLELSDDINVLIQDAVGLKIISPILASREFSFDFQSILHLSNAGGVYELVTAMWLVLVDVRA